MGLNRYLFSQRNVRAEELGRVERAQRRSEQRRSRNARAAEERIRALEEDLGYVSLVLGSLLHKLDENGTVARADLQGLMAELDGVDGIADGRLDVNILKEMEAD